MSFHFQEDLDNYKSLALTEIQEAEKEVWPKEPYVTEAQKKQRKRVDDYHRSLKGQHIRIGSKRRFI